MKVLIVGREKESAEKLFSMHNEFMLVSANPEMVVSFGGDGTLMEAEFLYPGVPKLYLKNSRIGKLAHNHTNEDIVAAVAAGNYTVEEHFKLEASAKREVLLGLNDIIVHNADPRHGIRYTVAIDRKQLGHEIIGDGVVFATPLGSTGYYRSITDSNFEQGIGLAFNNSTEQRDHIVLREDRTIEVRITRGPAMCYADNQKKFIELREGEGIKVARSSQSAKLIKVE